MATTLNRTQTDLFYSQRTFTNESKTGGSTDGDWFKSAWQYFGWSANQYNTIVDQYNGWEDEADANPSALIGTDPSGGTFSVASLPGRPRPIHK